MSTSKKTRFRRPPRRQWAEAMEVLVDVQLLLGWLPPSAVDHVSAGLGVKASAVLDHWTTYVRSQVSGHNWHPKSEQLRLVQDCRDFRSAYMRLAVAGLAVPYAVVERALWQAPDLLLYGLQQRERARREPSHPCPLCRDLADDERRAA